MKNYAIIDSGTVSNIILIDENSGFSITSNMIDLTGISPQPNIGDSYSDGNFTPAFVPVPTSAQYADFARQAAEAYINQFFNSIELLHVFQLTLEGSSTQKSMALAIQGWVNNVILEAVNHASNPNFTQFTPPPHTYLEIVSAT